MHIFMRSTSSACAPSRRSQLGLRSSSQPGAWSFARHAIAAVVALVMALAFALMPLVTADSASAADTTPTPHSRFRRSR